MPGGRTKKRGGVREGSTGGAQLGGLSPPIYPSTFSSESTFTGPGLKRFVNGDNRLHGLITAQNLEVAGAQLSGNFTLTDGPILWSGGGFGLAGGGMSTASNVVLVISGTNDIRLGGFFTNNGTAFWTDSGRLLLTYGSFVNAGTFVVRSNMMVAPYAADGQFFNSGLFINEGGSNTISFGPYVPFYNSGTVDVGSGNFTFSVSGGFRAFTQTAGLMRLAGGNVLGALNIRGGTLAGYETINGRVSNGGTVSPGDPIGALTIIGTYTHTGELDIDLCGPSAGVGYEPLICAC